MASTYGADSVPTYHLLSQADRLHSGGKLFQILKIFGAGDRDRTDDIQLGKLTFYH